MAPKHRKYPAEHVHFSQPECTSYLYPLNHPEYWAIRYFEDHTRQCHQCTRPFRSLCPTGRAYAGGIDSYMYSTGRHVRSTSNRRILLEVPLQFASARALLDTLQIYSPEEINQSSQMGQSKYSTTTFKDKDYQSGQRSSMKQKIRYVYTR
jgi:hypothetical protein